MAKMKILTCIFLVIPSLMADCEHKDNCDETGGTLLSISCDDKNNCSCDGGDDVADCETIWDSSTANYSTINAEKEGCFFHR